MKSLFERHPRTNSTESFEHISDPSFAFSFHPSETENKNRRAVYKKLVMAAFNTYLTEEQRDIITKYYFEQWTVYQLSEELGISASAVSKRLNKAKNTIHTFADACLKSGLFKDC